MSAIPLIKQGESFPFVFDLNGQDISGWVCTIFVKQFLDGPILIQRVIPPQDRAWPGLLLSIETALLAPNTASPYYLIGVLVNAESLQEIQDENRFHVSEKWA